MKYGDIVEAAKKARLVPYGHGKVEFAPCSTWLSGNQINLWTYWQGYQLKDIDEKGVDILLVGQDWGNPCLKRNIEACKRIEEIQKGISTAKYMMDGSSISLTDKTMIAMFKAFGQDVDITSVNPGMRLFFTNYSLGYRTGSETGGMTKTLLQEDKPFFDDLVLAINPKIIICLGKLTYEMVSGEHAGDFVRRLQSGDPFKASFPLKTDITVYGVAHCGARGRNNVGGEDKMKLAWDKIATEYKDKYIIRTDRLD